MVVAVSYFLAKKYWTDSKLRESSCYSLMLIALLANPVWAVAQEEADIGGTWSMIFTGETSQGRCGRDLIYAELHIIGKVPNTKWPTYEAMATAWNSSSGCLAVVKETSTAKLVVRGTRVSLSYEEQQQGFKAMGLPDWIANTVLMLFRTWTETSWLVK